MLNIRIDDPELEKNIRQTFGEDSQSIVRAFNEFVLQQRIKKDISISIEELESGEAITLKSVVKDIRSKYE